MDTNLASSSTYEDPVQVHENTTRTETDDEMEVQPIETDDEIEYVPPSPSQSMMTIECEAALTTSDVDERSSEGNDVDDEETARQFQAPLNLFVRPSEQEREAFFKCHPIRDETEVSGVIFQTKEGVPRKWLTFSKEDGGLHCSMCLAFGKYSFSTTESDRRHWTCRVQEHEQSSGHKNSVAAYMAWSHSNVIETAFQKQPSRNRSHIMEKRAFLGRIIDIVKVIGKCGLPYRGSTKNEAAYTLDNPIINHGVFLELVLLLTKYDKITENHIKDCVERSRSLHERKLEQKIDKIAHHSKSYEKILKL